ncbi:putative phage-associated protein [Flavobacterium sp. 270]|uniref:Panacea domain-containing protein n=1 Tax=Flavobacterium sp. 270 TaxID=2512114 RepID=UPI001065B57D|nr:type II toxin-antitoxin system antitoxin SocA domain-containing protein [Flavobacterium sp. 270]TDW46057.1 putative phage-associated protein [Flavobacterium sp. 270]
MAYNPTTVANYFIGKYSKTGNLTPMKVIKLTYIAYGWYLALTDKKDRLIDEKPLAWDFGPVFPSLYYSIKQYKKNIITEKIPNPVSNERISGDDEKFLDKIWELYGRFDGIYLSALTHTEGSPWTKVYRKDMNAVISDDDIFDHYKTKLKPISL